MRDRSAKNTDANTVQDLSSGAARSDVASPHAHGKVEGNISEKQPFFQQHSGGYSQVVEVGELEWLPKASQDKQEDDEGQGGGDLAVVANLDENGLFKGNSYSKILFELDVSIEQMLMRQRLYEQQLAATKRQQANHEYLAAEKLDQAEDIGIEVADSSSDADHSGPEFDRPEQGRSGRGMGA